MLIAVSELARASGNYDCPDVDDYHFCYECVFKWLVKSVLFYFLELSIFTMNYRIIIKPRSEVFIYFIQTKHMIKGVKWSFRWNCVALFRYKSVTLISNLTLIKVYSVIVNVRRPSVTDTGCVQRASY